MSECCALTGSIVEARAKRELLAELISLVSLMDVMAEESELSGVEVRDLLLRILRDRLRKLT